MLSSTLFSLKVVSSCALILTASSGPFSDDIQCRKHACRVDEATISIVWYQERIMKKGKGKGEGGRSVKCPCT